MLTKADKKYLEETFDYKLDGKLKPITRKLNRIQKTLTTHIRLTENQLKYHHVRLKNLEEHTGLEKPNFESTIALHVG